MTFKNTVNICTHKLLLYSFLFLFFLPLTPLTFIHKFDAPIPSLLYFLLISVFTSYFSPSSFFANFFVLLCNRYFWKKLDISIMYAMTQENAFQMHEYDTPDAKFQFRGRRKKNYRQKRGDLSERDEKRGT